PMGTATLVVSGMALSSTAWQVALGRILDISNTPRIAALLILCSACGIAVLAVSTTPAMLLVGGMLIGVGNGTEYALLSFVIPRYFGLRHYSEVYGSILSFVLLSMGLTPMLMDILYDARGSYDVALGLIGVVLVITSYMLYKLPAYRFDRAGTEINAAIVDH